jgi:hypothetical protein
LGQWKDAEAGWLLGQLALSNFDDPHMQTAIMSSAVPHVRTLLTSIFQSTNEAPPPAKLVEQVMALATTLNDEQVFISSLDLISAAKERRYLGWQFAAVAGFLDELDRRGRTLKQFHDSASPELKGSIERLQPMFEQVRTSAAVDSLLARPRFVARGS